METSVAGLDRLVADVPAPALRSALADAVSAADAGIGVKVTAAVTGAGNGGNAGTAAAVIALLEAADRSEAAIHGLDGAELSSSESTHPNSTAAFASGWLRARSAELAVELGGSAIELHAVAVQAQAEGRVLEAEDLYDAARPAERYLTAARLRSGSLLSLAAAFAAAEGGIAPREAESLTAAGLSLGIAAKIQRDVTGFVSRFVTGGSTGAAPGGALSNGVYSLPVIRAIEAEPKIASALGGPVAGEELIELVVRIRDAGGLARAAEDCREHADAARAELDGVAGGDGLAALADETATTAEGAAKR